MNAADRFLWLLPALAVIAGFAMAVQPAANGALAQRCTHPLQASIISFGTGFLALVSLGIALRVGWPDWERFSGMPLWAWCGGLIGTYMVTVSLFVAPRIGSTNWFALVVAGQLGLSLVLDHYGLLGFRPHPLSVQRVVGAIALATGAYLILKS